MKKFRILGTLVLFMLVLSIGAMAQNVNVTATAGTPNATYPTVTDAFNAINAGTHQGAITVDIVNNTTEPGSAVLNSNAAAPAAYTSVLIRPTVDGVTVAGATVTGRGLIELNGADSVAIDGDNPNTAGTNRNLTLQNTAANTVTFTSVIRIALNTTTVNTADNNIFRNLNVLGSATGRNVAANTATTGTQENTYGILASSNASGATTAPLAQAVLTTAIATGATATNLTIQNNSIQTVARAVAIQGSGANVFQGLLIENNLIGNATAGAADQVYSVGVTAQGSSNAVIRGNTVYVESFLGTQIRGLDFGFISATGSGALFDKNRVLRVRNNNAGTFGAYGINIQGGTTHTIQNNFVADIRNDQTAGTGAFSTTFGAFGIRIGGGTGHIVRHNSVHLFGAMPGTVSTNLTAAFGIDSTARTGVDVRNNIFSNQMTGGNPTGTRHVAVFLPSAATVAFNLTINNNAYYQGTDPLSRLAQTGTTFGAGEYTAANFNPNATTPATNFRAYTSTLSAAGTNDNASFALAMAPPFVSNTDLHIPAGTVTRLESGGAPLGVTDDIDSEARNATTPDIGADEFAGVPAPANDIAATGIVTPPNGAVIANGTSINPQASFTNLGTATQTNVAVTFTITGPGGYNYSNQQVIPSIGPNETVTVTFAPTPAFTTQGAYTTTATVNTPDSNTTNDTVSAGFTVQNPVSGTVTVGTGGTYPSLTNPGGVFQALNTVGASSNVVIDIISDLTGETGQVALNEIAGGFTVTIKPSGAARTISGLNTTTGMIRFNGTDGVTIDGSLSGGSDRSLTITNTTTGVNGAILYYADGANGARNNTIKNTNLFGASGPAGTLLGIAFADDVTFGGLGTDNDNVRIENNDIRGVFYGVGILGASAANRDTGTVITRNLIGSAANGIGRAGIYIINNDGAQITENRITNVVLNSSTTDAVGIAGGQQNVTLVPPAGSDMVNANIARNYIGVVQNTGTGSAVGIVVGSGAAGTNTVVNNMIAGVIGNSDATDLTAGMWVLPIAGATQNIFHNSISMTGDRGATANMTPSYALVITADQPTNVFNNILMNTQTRTGTGGGGQSYAIGVDVATFANITSNYNDLFVAGPLGVVGITGDLTTAAQTTTAGTGTNRQTLADWQAATGEDANSVSVDPLFTSLTDLHLTPTSPVRNIGTATVPATANDFDGDPRPLKTNVDIGADELIVSSAGNPIPAGTYYNVGVAPGSTLTGNVTVTGVLTFNGILDAGGFSLTIGCGATVTGAGPTAFVINGPVVKQFCGPESFTFPVGTATNNAPNKDGFGQTAAYSPMTANVTAVGVVPSSLAVSVTDTFMAGVDTANSIDRFWTLTETGDITADLTFQYTDNDVNGNEAAYKVLRRSGGNTVASPSSTVNTAANTATITGVQHFSDWSVGLPLAVAASIDIGGRVMKADGLTGIPKTRVTISGSTLPQPLVVYTSPFGYYQFDELPVGTYVLTVEAKQVTFTVPSRVITAEDNITNADFIANP